MHRIGHEASARSFLLQGKVADISRGARYSHVDPAVGAIKKTMGDVRTYAGAKRYTKEKTLAARNLRGEARCTR